MTQSAIGPQAAIDRFIEAVARLYRYKLGVQRPSGGALHHIQYDQPVFDIQITHEFFVLDALTAGATQSLLLATAGARRLYAKLGYEDVLFAQMFVPEQYRRG
jgi:hypothetical protein